MDTSSDSDADSVVNELPTGQPEEGEVSDLEQDVAVTDTDQENKTTERLDTETGHIYQTLM